MIVTLSLLLSFTRVDGAAQVEAVRKELEVPALGLAIVDLADPETKIWVNGVRKAGEEPPKPVQVSDMWHLGSCTKAITAATLAILANEKKISLDSPLSKAFSGMTVSPSRRSVTLRDLLAMRGGIDANPPATWWKYSGNQGTAVKQREAATKDGLFDEMKASSGELTYSNWSYVMAAYSAERATGKSIEELMEEKIFKPMKMKVGFGPLAANQPFPHRDNVPHNSSMGSMDNPPVMTAAGRAHMSLEDWAKFIREVLLAYKEDSRVLPKLYWKEIKGPNTWDKYSMGWVLAERDWAKGFALNHAGSNTFYCSLVWVAPELGKAYLAVTNDGGKRGETAVSKILERAISSGL